jgi:hypothetical protein
MKQPTNKENRERIRTRLKECISSWGWVTVKKEDLITLLDDNEQLELKVDEAMRLMRNQPHDGGCAHRFGEECDCFKRVANKLEER